ncbi:DUF4153 domain-containing protein [Aquimarina sediminis]|uniref:hypothetical protein n=1 Tax=Aquimarina sediminis TaxID=2070536 RepID=UPI000CA07EA0|nr:hypothetical protein [Aquimarina sediminis]
MYKTLDNLKEKIKEYKTLVMSFPVLLGGVFQIIDLCILSPSYIRYFSLSQSLSDGLLILTVLFCIFSFVYLFTPLIDRIGKDKKHEKTKEQIIESIKKILYAYPIILGVPLLAIFIFSIKINFVINWWVYLLTCFALAVYFIIFLWAGQKLNELLEGNKRYENAFHTFFNIRVLYIIAIAFLFFLYVMFKEITRNKNNTFLNEKFVKCYVNKNHPTKVFDILYSNNTYIFIKVDPYKNKKGIITDVLLVDFKHFTDLEVCKDVETTS